MIRLACRSWCCALLLAVFLSACKKAEPPQSTAPPPPETQAPPAQPAEAPAPKFSAGTGEPILLQVKWPVGNRYTYRMDLDQRGTNHIPGMPPMAQAVTMAMTYALSVIKETPTGGRQMEMEFLANEMDFKSGPVQMSYDSKGAGKDDAQNPLAAPFRKMIGSKVQLQTDASGKVEKILNYDEWVKGIAGGGGPVGEMLSKQFDEGFLRQISGFGTGLPEKPVAVGATWPFKSEAPSGAMGKVAVDSVVTFRGFEEHDQHKCALLAFKGTMHGDGDPDTAAAQGTPFSKMSLDKGSMDGTTWFDAELGALIESSQDQLMRMSGAMSLGGAAAANSPGLTLTMDVAQKITVKLVEMGKANP